MAGLWSSECPLCYSAEVAFYCQDRKRSYLQCANCQLVFVPSHFHLPSLAERREYDLHNNRLDDSGYLNFLSRTFEPLLSCLPASSHGLDFGCGPAPALAHQLRAAGHSCDLYDPFYFPDTSVLLPELRPELNFITATEVVEHLAQPGDVLRNLWQLLAPSGILAIMTKRVSDKEAFVTWHYKNDPTHIVFFSMATFQWLALSFNAQLNVVDNDVFFLHKPGAGEPTEERKV